METNSILEKWYDLHHDWPIASLEEKKHLAKETNLTVEQVKNWLKQKRFKLAHKKKDSKYEFLSSEIKTILDNFFDHKPHPNSDEIQTLKEKTGLHEKKIKTYFCYQNSKKKKSLMKKVIIESKCE